MGSNSTVDKRVSGVVLGRYVELETQMETLSRELKDLENRIISQLRLGYEVPSTYRAYIRESYRRNPAWKGLFCKHLQSEGMAKKDVDEFCEAVLERTEPSSFEELVVKPKKATNIAQVLANRDVAKALKSVS